MEPARTSSTIIKWLSNNKLFKRKGDSRETTLVSLNKGSYSITEDDVYKNFLIVVSNIIENNFQDGFLYFSEIRKKEFKFFIDFDYKDEVPLTDDNIINFGKDILECFKFILGDKYNEDFKLIITKSEPAKITTHNLEVLHKSGIHFYLPNFKVDSKNALKYRAILIQYLIHKYKERSIYNPWNDVIDSAVYTKSGLRLPFTNKIKKCECKVGCNDCDFTKTYNVNRSYKLLTTLNHNFQEDVDYNNTLQNPLNLLIDCSIRFNIENLKKLVIPDNFQINWYNKNKRVDRKNKKYKQIENIDELFDKKYNTKYDIDEIYDESDSRFKTMNSLMSKARKNGNFPHIEYKDSDIKRIFCYYKKDDTNPLFYIFQVNSTYCYNVKRNHNSNHIYFYLNKTKMYQKCFSKSKNHDDIVCDKSRIILMEKIPNKIKKIFFPIKKKQGNILFETK